MKKFLILSFAIAALLTSCNLNIESQGEKPQKKDTSVGFGVYMKRGVTTKAGYTGELTAEKLRTVANGFGVFSYYGNGALYNETSKPDFMYNQQVTFTTNGVWEYSPIKYWPNEYGAEAGSESADRLTFFAYAPYVAVTPSTGIVTAADNTDGILGMTRNIAAGDPMVMYGACLQPGGGVDLCWGVSADNFTSSVDGNKNNVASGDPFIDVIKPKTGDRLTFEFNHALSQLNVQIDTDVDVESHATSSLAPETRIYVRSVSFTGFTTRGSLNLNSKRGNPAWFDISGTGRLRRDPVTIYDGRSDGLEGVSTAADVNEEPATLSPKIIQSSPFDAQNRDGVTNTPVNLFSFADPVNSVADVNDPIMVIPIVGVPVTVTIVYDIETADPNLASFLSDGETHGVSTENKITKTVQMDGKNMTLEAGKRYVIGLHLGLTSVKFDAEVAPWDDTEYKGTADLPENVSLLGKITISDGSGTELTTPTVWRNQTMSEPKITVVDDLGNDISDACTFEWVSSDGDVATVNNKGVVTILAPGTTVIEATVHHGDQTGSKSYTLNVNEVTGLTVAAESSNIAIGGSTVVKATLVINDDQGINGAIATMPTVGWSSNYDEVTVDPTSSEAEQQRGPIVASTTAKASPDAVADTEAKITATIGKPFAIEDISNSTTLTCIDKISIKSVDLDATSTTVWLSQGASTPGVTVMGTDNHPLTTGVTKAWTSNNSSVATVTRDGVIELHGTGTATLTVTATLAASATTAADTETADFTLNVNDVTGVTVVPATSKIGKDGSLDLKATLTLNGGSEVNGEIATWPTVTWSSNYDKVSVESGTSTAAQVGSDIEATMKVSAEADAVINTQATITATVGTPTASSDVSGTSKLTCIDKISIASVDLGASSTTVWLSQGASTPRVTVMGTDRNPLTTGVTTKWTSNNGSVATVTDAGEITLHGTGTATLTVTATLAASATTIADTKTAEYKVYVNNVTKVTVAPATSKIGKGGSLVLKATLTLNGGSEVNGEIATWPTVTWSSNYDKVSVESGTSTAAQVGSDIEATMKVSAEADAVINTQATITAAVSTPTASSDVSGTSTLTCVDMISIKSVDLDATSTTVWLSQGASTPGVTVMGTDNHPLTTGVTKAWTSNNSSVATVTDAGVVTLHGTGTATLTVTATLAASATTAADTETADFTLNVNDVTGIKITTASSSLYVGGTLPVSASLILNGDENNRTIYGGTLPSTPSVTWESNNSDAVSVVSSVEVDRSYVSTTTATAKAAGTATIKATIGTPYASSSRESNSITLKSIGIKSVDLDATSTTVWLSQGATTPGVTVMGTDDNPLTTDVTTKWTSNNGSVATVTDAGVVTLHGTGTATLTVTASLPASATTTQDTKTADFELNVNNVTGVTISPAEGNINIGSTLDLTATLTINDGGVVYGTLSSNMPTVTWSSTGYDKISVETATSTASQVESDIVATMKVSAASDAEATKQAVITAKFGNASGTSTLTCVIPSTTGTGTGHGYTGWNNN